MQKHKLILLISLIAVMILLLLFGIKSGINLDKLQSFIKNLGILAPLVFILIYTIGPVFFMPITPLSITGGVLFGPVWGTVYTVIGATFGACASFLVSRYLVKDWVDNISSDKVALIQRRVQEEGWKFIAISRITPVFPFNAQNYVFGLTNISLKTFFITTIFSMIPGSFTYVYIGYAGKMALSDKSSAFIQIAIAITLMLLFSFSPFIIKRIKLAVKKFKEKRKYCVKL